MDNHRISFFGLWKINQGRLRYQTEASSCTYLITFSFPSTSPKQWLVDFFQPPFHSDEESGRKDTGNRLENWKAGRDMNYIPVINEIGGSTKQSYFQSLRMESCLTIGLTILHHLERVAGASFYAECNYSKMKVMKMRVHENSKRGIPLKVPTL